MIRVGVHYDQMTPGHRNLLDRFIFKKMREEIQRKRHLRGILYRALDRRGQEHRFARRIRIEAEDPVRLQLAAEAGERRLSSGAQGRFFGELERDAAAPSGTHQIFDLSTSGGAYLCPPASAPRPGSIISFKIWDAEFSIEATAHVIYTVEHSEH